MATTTRAARAKKTPSGTEPEFRVVENNLHVITTTEGEIVLPLKVKTKVFRKIAEDEGDEMKQLFGLLDELGDEQTPAILDELDIFETQSIVARFFEEFTAKAQASVGESQRSSNS